MANREHGVITFDSSTVDSDNEGRFSSGVVTLSIGI